MDTGEREGGGEDYNTTHALSINIISKSTHARLKALRHTHTIVKISQESDTQRWSGT